MQANTPTLALLVNSITTAHSVVVRFDGQTMGSESRKVTVAELSGFNVNELLDMDTPATESNAMHG
jgi:hypothetical protein